MTHTLGGVEQGGERVHHKLRTVCNWKLIVSENFRLVFLDSGVPPITEILESKTADTRGLCLAVIEVETKDRRPRVNGEEEMDVRSIDSCEQSATNQLLG